MICMYDLYDLYSVFVGIRSSTKHEINRLILSNIIHVLKHSGEVAGFNQIRIAIQPALQMDSEKIYGFASTENEYTYIPLHFLKDPNIYQLLIESCEQLLLAINEGDSEKIYDLADCLHNLPIMLVENNYSVPNRFWKNEIKAYRRKWDKDFLMKEEKAIKQPGARLQKKNL